MNKRQKEVIEEQLHNEEKTIASLKNTYKQALKDCEQKIRELSARTDMENLQSIIYQKQYQEALKAQLEGVLSNLQSNSYATVSDYLTKCYRDGYTGVMYDLQKTGIPIIMPIDQAAVVRAIQTDSKLSKSLYDKMGEDVTYLKKAVRAEVSRGIANGSTWNEVAGKLSRHMANTPFQRAYNNSIRIARTEGHRIQNASALDAMHAAKSKGADIVKQWDSTLDGRTRDNHRLLDGQIREIDEPFEVSGLKADAPGMFGDPAEDCNCRCCLLQRARWALDEEELDTLKERAEYFGLDKTENFEEYKKKYLNAQDRVRSDTQKMNDTEQSKVNARRAAWKERHKKEAKNVANIPDFDKMQYSDIVKWANENLKTRFENLNGVNKDYYRETVKALSKFESKMGRNTINGLSVKFGGTPNGVYAKYDDKAKTLLLKKTGSLEKFVESQKNANARYRIKWHVDKDYYATTSFEGTVLHELGHAVDIDTGQALSRKLSDDAKLFETSAKISVYAGSPQGVRVTPRSEAWAENFAAYMEGGAKAKEVPKEIQDMIEGYFEKRSLANAGKSSTMKSGAVSGARNPFGEKAKEHAQKYYGLVRSMKTDVAKISKATGMSEDDIQTVKNFIFLDKHDLGGKELEYFEPDYMMAESWQRLTEGKPEKHDITMLNHEVLERKLMEDGLSQEEAHIKASKKYNYSKEAGEYYAKIKKYKKE